MSQELMNWLKKPQPFQSFYFVYGTDTFFLSEIKKTFKKNLLEAMEDFNYDEVYASETPLGEILTLCETLPLFSKTRLLFCFKADEFSEKDWTQLIPLFDQKEQGTVFVCFFEKKDGRKKHFKILKDKIVELSAFSLKSWELNPWLDFLSRKENLKLSFSARKLFQEFLGTNLMEIQMELRKLRQYLGDKKEADEEDIIACTSRLKIESLFDLTEALGHKDIVKSLSLLAKLLEQNQNEISMISLLVRHIRILFKLKQGQKEKLSPSQLAQKAGLAPYFLKKYLKQVEMWTETQLENTLQSLFLTDKALKSSPLSPHIWLENFILKSCS